MNENLFSNTDSGNVRECPEKKAFYLFKWECNSCRTHCSTCNVRNYCLRHFINKIDKLQKFSFNINTTEPLPRQIFFRFKDNFITLTMAWCVKNKTNTNWTNVTLVQQNSRIIFFLEITSSELKGKQKISKFDKELFNKQYLSFSFLFFFLV